MSGASYKTLAVTQPTPFVTQVELNRPDKLNSFSHSLWMWVDHRTTSKCWHTMSFLLILHLYQCHFIASYFRELKECFNALSRNPDCRAIVLTAAGKHFTAGLDLKESLSWGQQLAEIEDSARKGHFLEQKIKDYQVRPRPIRVRSALTHVYFVLF